MSTTVTATATQSRVIQVDVTPTDYVEEENGGVDAGHCTSMTDVENPLRQMERIVRLADQLPARTVTDGESVSPSFGRFAAAVSNNDLRRGISRLVASQQPAKTSTDEGRTALQTEVVRQANSADVTCMMRGKTVSGHLQVGADATERPLYCGTCESSEIDKHDKHATTP